MAGKPKYVSLEPDAFLSDEDFQIMSAEERGVYITIIFYLYRNNGKVKYEETKLRKLCNVNGEFSFQSVLGKFQVRRGYIRHKRVSKELRRSQILIDRGVKAAKARWDKHSSSNAQASVKQCQVKLTEVKGSNKRVFTPPTLEEVKKYITDNPELNNVDPVTFFKGFNDSGWIDTRGNKVRNWKLKLRTWSKFGNGKRQYTDDRGNNKKPFVR